MTGALVNALDVPTNLYSSMLSVPPTSLVEVTRVAKEVLLYISDRDTKNETSCVPNLVWFFNGRIWSFNVQCYVTF